MPLSDYTVGEKLVVDDKVFSAYSSALASVRLVGCCLKLMNVRVSFGFDCERVRLSPARDICRKQVKAS